MKNGGSFLDWEVDEVRFVLAVIPVFILLLPYQTIYNQVSSEWKSSGAAELVENFRFDYGYENEYDYEIFISLIFSFKPIFVVFLDQLPFVRYVVSKT